MRKKQLFALLMASALSVGMAPTAAFAAADTAVEAASEEVSGELDAADTEAPAEDPAETPAIKKSFASIVQRLGLRKVNFFHLYQTQKCKRI